MKINVLEYFVQGALVNSPNKVGIVDGDRRFTFSDIWLQAKIYASAILGRTESYNQPIAIFLPKCAEVIFSNLGILYSGNCYANLDVKTPSERLKAILTQLGSKLIITSKEYAAVLFAAGLQPELMLYIEDINPTVVTVWNDISLEARIAHVIDTDPLCIIHTSGSTGIPKGVALNHRSTIDFIDWACDRLKLESSETIGSLSPFFFDIYTLELYFCLAKGATLVIIPEKIAAFPATLLDYLTDYSINFIFWVPTIMVNIANQNLLAKKPPISLQKILFAGEVFPAKHLNYWRRNLPDAMFVNLYGPIEITVDCTYFIVDREIADNERLPIGFPCRNTNILILTEQNRLAEKNELGELCVRGSSLALGYWNDPVRTAHAFTQNPLHNHYPENIYRTGDLVYLNEFEEIIYVGRKDHQVKHLGYRIELGEIEHAVMELGCIRNACITYDSSQKDIVLHYEAEKEVLIGEMRRMLGQRLPKYMLPTKFRQYDQLPKNPNGKIDRMALLRK